MASQALYLKWRPQRFDDVVGQEHITQTLQNALRSGRVAHAYLFTGPRGTGKTTMARLLAKAVNCLAPDVNVRPCNVCHICTSVNEGRLLDLIEMDAASNTGVDNVREAIREKVGFRPNEARYKVYVIDEVHMLSTSAFNALLKTLEEPPEHVIFILATTEPHKILPTIISRCQRFDFRRIPLVALTARLRDIAEQENVQIEQGALRFIARLSTGCARDAIGLLDQLTAFGDEIITTERVSQVLGLGDAATVHALAVHLANRAIGLGLDVIHQAIEGGVDTRQFTQQAIDYLRVLLLLGVGDQTGIEDVDAQTQSEMQTLAQLLSTHQLVRAIKLFNQAQLDLRGSDQNQIALELAFVEAALGEPRPAADRALAPAQGLPGQVLVRTERPRVELRERQPEPAQTALERPAAKETAAARPEAGQPAADAASIASRPAAPSRSSTRPPAAEPEVSPPAETPQPTPAASQDRPLVTMEALDENWAQIKHAVRTQSRQAEALLNSASIEGIEDGNRIVLALPSRLLAEKLEKAETRRVIEQAMQSALDQPCLIRTTVGSAPAAAASTPARTTPAPAPAQEAREDLPPFDPGPIPGAAAESGPEPGSVQDDATAGIRQQAGDDPVVQELLRQGGEITDVEALEQDDD